jgi:hypothetical protein
MEWIAPREIDVGLLARIEVDDIEVPAVGPRLFRPDHRVWRQIKIRFREGPDQGGSGCVVAGENDVNGIRDSWLTVKYRGGGASHHGESSDRLEALDEDAQLIRCGHGEHGRPPRGVLPLRSNSDAARGSRRTTGLSSFGSSAIPAADAPVASSRGKWQPVGGERNAGDHLAWCRPEGEDDADLASGKELVGWRS